MLIFHSSNARSTKDAAAAFFVFFSHIILPWPSKSICIMYWECAHAQFVVDISWGFSLSNTLSSILNRVTCMHACTMYNMYVWVCGRWWNKTLRHYTIQSINQFHLAFYTQQQKGITNTARLIGPKLCEFMIL